MPTIRPSRRAEALDPIAGNWLELKRIGNTYGKSGTALGTVGGDLARATNTIDPYWDGRAAVTFIAYSRNLSDGLEWDAAVGRLLDRGLTVAASALEDAARAIVKLIQKGLSRFVKVDSFQGILKLAAKVVPGIGTATAVAEVASLLLEVQQAVAPMIREIEQTIDALKQFIEFCKDPLGFTAGKIGDAAQKEIDKKLKPLTDAIDEYNKKKSAVEDGVQLARDVVTAGQINRVQNIPDAAYDAGTGTQPWEDAE